MAYTQKWVCISEMCTGSMMAPVKEIVEEALVETDHWSKGVDFIELFCGRSDCSSKELAVKHMYWKWNAGNFLSIISLFRYRQIGVTVPLFLASRL